MGIDNKEIPPEARDFKVLTNPDAKHKEQADIIAEWFKKHETPDDIKVKIETDPDLDYLKSESEKLNNLLVSSEEDKDFQKHITERIVKNNEQMRGYLESLETKFNIKKKMEHKPEIASGGATKIEPGEPDKVEKPLQAAESKAEQSIDIDSFIRKINEQNVPLEQKRDDAAQKLNEIKEKIIANKSFADGLEAIKFDPDFQRLRSFVENINTEIKEETKAKQPAKTEAKAESTERPVKPIEMEPVNMVDTEEKIEKYALAEATEKNIDATIEEFIEKKTEDKPEILKKAHSKSIREIAADFKRQEPEKLKEILAENKENIEKLTPDLEDLYKKGIAEQRIDDLQEANEIIGIILQETKTEIKEPEKTPMEIIYGLDEEIKKRQKSIETAGDKNKPAIDEIIEVRKEQIDKMIETYKITGNKEAITKYPKDKLKQTKFERAIIAAVEKGEI